MSATKSTAEPEIGSFRCGECCELLRGPRLQLADLKAAHEPVCRNRDRSVYP